MQGASQTAPCSLAGPPAFKPVASRPYSCFVVVFERVVVVPPSGSVAVVVWLSVLPAQPPRGSCPSS